MKLFEVSILNFLGGYCKKYWMSTFPVFGNRNQAARMRNIDLRNPNIIKPGPAFTALTAGTQDGNVKQLINKIMPVAEADNVSYALGGTAVFKISSTEVLSELVGTSAVILWPHTIGDVAHSKDGEDIVEYHNYIFYSYDHASGSGDVGRYDIANETFDDDYMSTVPTTAGTLTYGVPHPLLVGGDDILYIGNGYKVSTFNITTKIFTSIAIDLPDDCVVQDIKYYNQRVYITVNWPNLSGNNQVKNSLFVWDTVSVTWDYEVPRIKRGGGMFIKTDGVLYIFYEDITSSGAGRLGYVNGTQIVEVAQWDGGIPAFNQIWEDDGFICFISTVGSEDLAFAWGSGDPSLPTRLFQLTKADYNTIGGVGSPFGDIMVASTDGATNFSIAKESGYQTDAYWKGVQQMTSGANALAYHDRMILSLEQPERYAALRVALRNSKNIEFFMKSLSFETDGDITKKIYTFGKDQEDMRFEADWSLGSRTNTISLRSAIITGHTIDG